MKADVEELVRDVRVAIDMNRRDDSLAEEGDPDTLELDELIRSKICEGIDMVHLEAPARLLETTYIEEARPGLAIDSVDNEGRGLIMLPDNYLRFVLFKMDGWRYTVYEAIDETDVRYQQQWSRWKGIHGTPEKPVVAITGSVGNKRTLEIFTTEAGKHIYDSRHMLMAEIDNDNKVVISKKCYRSAVYRIAGLVLTSLNDALGGIMKQQSEEMLQ